MFDKAQEKLDTSSKFRQGLEAKPARRIPLGREDMIELFDYLEDGLVADSCDHCFRYTEAFLATRGIASAPALKWIREFGATCDCEVLQNIELEWGGPPL